MSDAALKHEFEYIPEEHAPDPVIGHGDPLPPGKLAIWLFLASEIMFFIGLLGTYIVLRSGSPGMFENQGMMLSKRLASINTLVLIFSSLTMALAVDAAQKGNRTRLIQMLCVTIVMAFGFMGIKYVEYKDKLTHYTVIARSPKPISFTAPGHDKLYAVAREGRRPFSNVDHKYVPQSPRNWGQYAIELTKSGESFSGFIPGGAGAATVIDIHAQQGAAPAPTDEKLSTGLEWTSGLQIHIYDGHSTDARFDGTGDSAKFVSRTLTHARRRLLASDELINVHTYSPDADRALPVDTADYHLTAGDIHDATWYGPQKNIFYSCYFALTAVHGLHVVGGIFPMVVLLIFALRGRILAPHTEYVGLYWHFVDLVWIFLFPLLYLI